MIMLISVSVCKLQHNTDYVVNRFKLSIALIPFFCNALRLLILYISWSCLYCCVLKHLPVLQHLSQVHKKLWQKDVEDYAGIPLTD